MAFPSFLGFPDASAVAVGNVGEALVLFHILKRPAYVIQDK